MGGDAEFLAEGVGQMELVHVYVGCQQIQGQGLPVVVLDIPAHGNGIGAQILPGRCQHLGKIGFSQELDQQNIQKILAHGLKSGIFPLDPYEHILQIELHIAAVLIEAENLPDLLDHRRYRLLRLEPDVERTPAQ